MKRVLVFLTSLLLLTSCDRIRSESEAIEHNDRGIMMSNLGDSEGALKAFKEALAVGNLSTETKSTILRNIAQTYFELLENDSATKYYRLAADCYPEGSYEYLVNVADIRLHETKTVEAIKLLHQAAEMKPNEIEVNNTLGLIYLGEFGDEHYDADKALKYNLKAYEINDDRITGDILGRNYIALDEYDKAKEMYEELVDLYPEMAELKYQLATVEYYQENTDRGDELFEQVLEIDSEYEDAINQFKLIYSAELESIEMEAD